MRSDFLTRAAFTVAFSLGAVGVTLIILFTLNGLSELARRGL